MSRDFDIAQNIRTVENLKVRLLSGVAGVFEATRASRSMEEASDILSEVIVSAYLLGEYTGASFNELDEKILKLLRLNILKDEGLSWENAKLSEHIKARSR